MEAKEPAQETSLPSVKHDCLGHEERCPLCGGDNACRVAKGQLYKGPCWCHQMVVPGHIVRQLVPGSTAPACLCRPCLETIAQVACEMADTKEILLEIQRQVAIRTDAPDFYLDEFGNTVFTAAYHLKRGNCCGNQCRHCPY